MTYTLLWDAMRNQVSDTMILRDEDQAYIPFDDDNTDYQAYKAWLAEGNQPTPYTGPGAPSAPEQQPAPTQSQGIPGT